MPAKASSLRITEAYRARMVALRNRAKAQARQTWGQVRPGDLDGTYRPALLALHIAALQREGARLSAGYLAAFVASELDTAIPVPPATAMQAGQARTGDGLHKAFLSPMIGVKVNIGEGMAVGEALVKGRRRLERTAGLATDEAVREALRVAMELSPDVEGWQRAVKGTCAACMGAAESSRLPPGTPLEIHPNCECVSEPAVRPKSPQEVLRNHTEDWGQREWDSIERYIRSPDSYTINSHLRDVMPNPQSSAGRAVAQSELTEAEINSAIKELDDLIERAGPLGTEVRTTRVAGVKLKDSGLSRRKMPYTLTDRGFGSTAALREEGITGPGVRYDLDIDARVKGIWGSNPRERELLLQRGCRYVIRSIEKVDKMTYHVRADVLPPE